MLVPSRMAATSKKENLVVSCCLFVLLVALCREGLWASSGSPGQRATVRRHRKEVGWRSGGR